MESVIHTYWTLTQHLFSFLCVISVFITHNQNTATTMQKSTPRLRAFHRNEVKLNKSENRGEVMRGAILEKAAFSMNHPANVYQV